MPNTTIHTFFDEYSSTFTYVLHQGQGSDCAIIDPVLDYNPNSGRTSTQSAEKVAAYVRVHGLRLQWIIETHAHADHLSASVYLREQLGGQTVIGQSITTVQRTFADIFNLSDLATDGSQFDKLLADGDSITLGSLRIEALHVPGHTPADSAWRVHMPEGHYLFATRRHSTVRFSWRQRQPALPKPAQAAGLARRYAPVPLSQLC